jgi:hypothetical protein
MKLLSIVACLAILGLTAIHPVLPVWADVQPVITPLAPAAASIDTHIVTVVMSTLIPVTLYLLKERYPAAFSQTPTGSTPTKLVSPTSEEVDLIRDRVQALEDHVFQPPKIYPPSLNGDGKTK